MKIQTVVLLDPPPSGDPKREGGRSRPRLCSACDSLSEWPAPLAEAAERVKFGQGRVRGRSEMGNMIQ